MAAYSNGHHLDFLEPFLIEFRSVQNEIGDSGTMKRRVGPDGSGNDLELTDNSVPFLGVSAQYAETTCSLTIESHILSEGLS